MEDAPVLFEVLPAVAGKGVGVVTLNAEKTLNSLSLPMIELVGARLRLWREDPDIAIVVLQGAGERAFSAGGDIQDLYQSMCEHPGGPNPYADAFFEQEYRLDYFIHTFPKPVLVWAQGFVMGGGLGVMAACSHRIGTVDSRIAMPEITIGLFPDAGATWFLTHMPRHFAYFLAWTGSHINAVDGKQVGFIDHLITLDCKPAVTTALQETPWTGDPEKNELLVSELLGRFEARGEGFPPGMLASHEGRIKALIEPCHDADRPAVAFNSRLDQLDPGDQWLTRAVATFRQGSPTTAHIIAHQIERATGLTLEAIFQLELTIAIQCSRHPDFAEGIRALLIDRDGKPDWHFRNLESVDESWVEAHFKLPFKGDHPLADLGGSTD
ncbi:MAG: enoyl-CoA hydratase/isomerase family protein [Pseudomonadales bacterium]